MARAAGTGRPLVLATAQARRVPAAPAGVRRWIWPPARGVSDAHRIEAAALAGAYDVDFAASPCAAADLIARLEELLVAGVVLPRPARS